MKKKTILLLLILFISGCGAKKEEPEVENIKVENISSYVVRVPNYSEINDEKANLYMKEKFDGWTNDVKDVELEIEGACTSSAKIMKNGDMVVSRNMDLALSLSPEYIYFIDAPDRYRSFNVTYIPDFGGNYDEIIKDGLDKDKYDLIPYFATDAMNEYGFSIEMNMRNAEYDFMTGEMLLGSSGTNKGANLRISSMALVRYLVDNAKDVNEALKIIGAINNETHERYGEGQIDIYSLNSEASDSGLAYQIADASGNYGVIEIADNKVIYYPKQSYQANFYIGDEFRTKELFGVGQGRIETIMKDYDEIENIYQMIANMSKVRYSSIYKPDSALYDIRTEFAGVDVFNDVEVIQDIGIKNGFKIPDYSNLEQTVYDYDTNEYIKVNYSTYKNYPNSRPSWTSDFVLDDNNKEEVFKYANWFAEVYSSLTDYQRRELGMFFVTTHHITYNNTKQYVIMSFYENEETTEVFSFKDLE